MTSRCRSESVLLRISSAREARYTVFMWNIVVQHIQSLRYLQPDDSWAHDVSAARSFQTVHAAMDHCTRSQFENTRIVLGVMRNGRMDPSSKVILRVHGELRKGVPRPEQQPDRR